VRIRRASNGNPATAGNNHRARSGLKKQDNMTDSAVLEGVRVMSLGAISVAYITLAHPRLVVGFDAFSKPTTSREIDGLDIYFIHVRSRHEDALPLIVTHGWPGSITEQMKIIIGACADQIAETMVVDAEPVDLLETTRSVRQKGCRTPASAANGRAHSSSQAVPSVCTAM